MTVKRNKLYTKKGDDGTTSLIGGERVSKSHVRVSAYGSLDELNSLMGWIRTEADKTEGFSDISKKIKILQNQLFDLGAELACPPGSEWEGMNKVTAEMIKGLESWIDESSEKVPALKNFILPGGTELNSRLHIGRTSCRRVERLVTEIKTSEGINEQVIHYLNRLSDLLFTWAREASHRQGAQEHLWGE